MADNNDFEEVLPSAAAPARSRMDSIPVGMYDDRDVQKAADYQQSSNPRNSDFDFDYSADQLAAQHAILEQEEAAATEALGNYHAIRTESIEGQPDTLLTAANGTFLPGRANPRKWGVGKKQIWKTTVDAEGNETQEESKNPRREGPLDDTERGALDMWNSKERSAHDRFRTIKLKKYIRRGIPGVPGLDRGIDHAFALHEALHERGGECQNQQCRELRQHVAENTESKKYRMFHFKKAHTEIADLEQDIRRAAADLPGMQHYEPVTEDEFKSNRRFLHIGRLYGLSQWLKISPDKLRQAVTSTLGQQQAKRSAKAGTQIQAAKDKLEVRELEKAENRQILGIKRGEVEHQTDLSATVGRKDWMTVLDNDSTMSRVEKLWAVQRAATHAGRQRKEDVTQMLAGTGKAALPKELQKAPKAERDAWLADNPEAVASAKKNRILQRDVREAHLRAAAHETVTGPEGIGAHAQELLEASQTGMSQVARTLEQQEALSKSDETRRRPSPGIFTTPQGARDPGTEYNFSTEGLSDAEIKKVATAQRIASNLPHVIREMADMHNGTTAEPLVLPSEMAEYKAAGKAQKVPVKVLNQSVRNNTAAISAQNDATATGARINPEELFSAATEVHEDAAGNKITIPRVTSDRDSVSEVGSILAKQRSRQFDR